ncbi:ribonuclease HI [uncultured Desulfobulbus sp.]|uniref:ribonuclease HI n=1 Tax=uncultured Desulfobulbus sp. TaxID=239745 RepID=UPI0029C6F051|nr:ribonuclease HI [uncultured Desulfobulbus sp.]
MQHVEIYTDGGCLGNPGRGGYGAILAYGEHRRELSGGYQHTTNNRMEMMACIFALGALKRECAVTVYSDSKYLVDGVSKGWAVKWKRNNWKRSGGERAENVDLWERLLTLMEKHHVKFLWVKGHDGHQENERCDQLATEAANGSDLLEDAGYIAREQSIPTIS